MAYIAPNSTVKLLARLPITNTYCDSVWYDTPSDQLADMNDHVKVQLTQYSYVRHGRNYLRVTLPNITVQHPDPNDNVADALFDINYMMFQNTNFGSKWFYAFVTDVEYINNSTAELTYEIDVIQTFMFDYMMPNVYVEREHSATDGIGDNVVEEKINIGDLVPYDNKMYRLNYDFTNITLILLYVRDSSTWNDAAIEYYELKYPMTGGNFFNRIYSCCDKEYVSGRIDTQAGLNLLISAVHTKIEGINALKGKMVGMLEIPNQINVTNDFMPGHLATYFDIDATSLYPDSKYGIVSRPTSFKFQTDPNSNFTVKNNKLFTYPYNQLVISNREGSTATYRYEYFTDPTNMTIGFTYAVTPIFEHCMYPTNYMYEGGVNDVYTLVPDLAVSGGVFPIPTFSEDSFALWQAQKSGAMNAEIIGNIIKTAVLAVGTCITGGASAGVTAGFSIAGAAVSGASTAIAQSASAMNAPDVMTGGNASGELLCARGCKGFDIKRMQIKPTIAKQLDDYFTQYGYACRTIKLPNIYTAAKRPYWNYVKTVGCHVHPREDYTGHTFSGIPMDYVNKINTIWDNGIRFWMDGLDSVDDYSKNNAP